MVNQCEKLFMASSVQIFGYLGLTEGLGAKLVVLSDKWRNLSITLALVRERIGNSPENLHQSTVVLYLIHSRDDQLDIHLNV